jgi:hypothetical protein
MRSQLKPEGLVPVVALAASLLFNSPAVAGQAREGSPELAALVPRLEGWSPAEAPRSFFPDDLFEYIDGAAESYLSYDFRELLVADLEKKGTDASLTLEIYDMGGPVNAFGIFGSERFPDNKTVPVGQLAYCEGEALNFLAGRFYVKMLAFGLGEGTEAFLGEVGAKVASGIKPSGELPALIKGFPSEGLVARSEKYIKKNFMGYAFLSDGYVASYRAGDREIEGFFIETRSDDEAESLVNKLSEALAADGAAPAKVAGGVRVRNRYGQNLFFGRVGRIICGAMRVPDGLGKAGEALFGALTASLAKGGTGR